ncbi:putative pectinesterase inhibitor domain, Cell wall/vacuolar inhibitor of fructosidase [Helianthus annuus]|nr:putative pectinesterase inhibitor domain, Cell wall/vacuolar inhibitor of fructosidase [Helianthus annuus]
MKFSSPLTILFLLLLLQQTLFSAMADRQFIENTCKGTPSPDLCLEILLASRESENADLTGLALIGVDAVQDRGFEILRQVVDLKNSQPELTPALDICAKVYHAVVDSDVLSSREALRDGVAKFAEDGMADSAVEAQACERSFGEHGQSSPITDSNSIMNDVANVVRAIIRMLL